MKQVFASLRERKITELLIMNKIIYFYIKKQWSPEPTLKNGTVPHKDNLQGRN